MRKVFTLNKFCAKRKEKFKKILSEKNQNMQDILQDNGIMLKGILYALVF